MKKLILFPEVGILSSLLIFGACAAPVEQSGVPSPSPASAEARRAGPAPRIVRPGAPGEEARIVGLEELSAPTSLPHTEADVLFMQGMIPHHAQALDMTALVEERTESEDIRLLARRIEISQRDEIALMGTWLEQRGEEVPGEHAHHMMEDHLMPGMLTAEDMAALAAARGPEFDRLFLEFMIMHHEGAIFMVRELFSNPGAGQETGIFTFASHVDADQQIEIRRMSRMLTAGR